ncbi:hypothetical protein PybrP1_009026 [[Pythium] brassicae (nom. inval.)]|nr:hypothetical protein PybrP1_009026 [[Pythium] brassicae (nom. inval.)]
MLLARDRDIDRSENARWRLLICGEAGAELQRPAGVSVPVREHSVNGFAKVGAEQRTGVAVHRGWDDNESSEEEGPPEYTSLTRHASEFSEDEDEANSVGGSSTDDDEQLDPNSNDEFAFEAVARGDEHSVPADDASDGSCIDNYAPRKSTRGGIEGLEPGFGPHRVLSETREKRPLRRATSFANTTTQSAFEPAAVRIQQRSSSARHLNTATLGLDADQTNKRTQNRRASQLELRQSKRDIRDAKELQRRIEAAAHVRKQQLLTQRRRKLRAHDQRRADARKAAQLVSDTLEYRDVLQSLETQVKRTAISTQREQERLKKSTHVALGPSDRHRTGPILGPGPLSQLEIDAFAKPGCALGDNRSHLHRNGERDALVYDLHGRHHAAEAAGDVVALGVFESAMRKIKRALDRGGAQAGSSGLIELFRELDADRTGALSRREFERVLAACGAALTTKEVAVRFEHFDPNRSGAIDYGELLWGFFNRRAFLKKWQLRKTTLSAHEVERLFCRYDRTGCGALSVRDFQLAMNDIGFKLADDELKLLVLKFDANRDGFIDYHEFHAFVTEGDQSGCVPEDGGSGGGASGFEEASVARDGRREKRRASDASDGHPERILAELRALSETQAKIRRSIQDPFNQM